MWIIIHEVNFFLCDKEKGWVMVTSDKFSGDYT
jgi:hypothetical protein